MSNELTSKPHIYAKSQNINILYFPPTFNLLTRWMKPDFVNIILNQQLLSQMRKFPISHRVRMGVILYICCVFPEHFFLRMDSHFSSFNFFNTWGRITSFSIVSWSHVNMCEFTYNQYGSHNKTPYTLKL